MADLITMMSAAAGQVNGINPREYFNTVLYTGDNTNNRFISAGMTPDLTWLKSRSDSFNHALFDAVRGAGNYLSTNSTGAENFAGSLGWTNSGPTTDGFIVDYGTNATINGSGSTFVAWNWNAGGSNATNTDGTITSTVRANPTAGFSIVSYTGTGTGTPSVGHGLNQKPDFWFIKDRDNATDWIVYTQQIDGTLDFVRLNTTAAKQDSAASVPTNSVFYVTGSDTNPSGADCIAYVFHSVEGFSKFGSYTGNGSATGPSVTTDFEPTWLMIKRTDTTGEWIILDSARDASNPRTEYLKPNTGGAEATGNDVDFNSTGFQLKSTSVTINASGGTYIYACFA